MASRLQVPFSPRLVAPEVAARIVSRKPGQVLDCGRVHSEWGEGDIVLTSLGVVLIDEESGEAIGIRWSRIGGELSTKLDPSKLVVVPVQMPGQDPIRFSMSGRLVSNMGALADQLGEGELHLDQELTLVFDSDRSLFDVIDLRSERAVAALELDESANRPKPSVVVAADGGCSSPGVAEIGVEGLSDASAQPEVAQSEVAQSEILVAGVVAEDSDANEAGDSSPGSGVETADAGDDSRIGSLHKPSFTDRAATAKLAESTDRRRKKSFYRDPRFWVGLGAEGVKAAGRKLKS